MKLYVYTKMSLDTIGRSKARSLLAMVGVAVGVFSVLILVAIGDAARSFVRDQFVGLGASLVRVVPGKTETRGVPMVGGSARAITVEDVRYIRRRTPEAQVAGLVLSNGTLKAGSRSRALTIMGSDEPFPDMYGMQTQSGAFFTEQDVASGRLVCVLGQRAAEEIFGQQNPVGQYVQLLSARFRIIGVFAPKGFSLGSDLDDMVVIPSTAAAQLLHEQGVHQLLVKTPDRWALDGVLADVKQLLAARHHGEDFTVLSSDDLLNTVDAVMMALSAVVVAIAMISLFVGGMGIANIMLMSVKQRTREIGVRRAIGAKRRDIIYQFLCESGVISGLGGLVGVLFALLLVLVGRLGFDLPMGTGPLTVGGILGFSIVVGILAGIIPARQASAVSPNEALRAD